MAKSMGPNPVAFSVGKAPAADLDWGSLYFLVLCVANWRPESHVRDCQTSINQWTGKRAQHIPFNHSSSFKVRSSLSSACPSRQCLRSIPLTHLMTGQQTAQSLCRDVGIHTGPSLKYANPIERQRGQQIRPDQVSLDHSPPSR